MKSILIALAALGSLTVFADDYGVDRVLASSAAAKAASEYLLEVNDVKDRPFTVQVSSHLNELQAIIHVKELKDQLKDQKESAFYYPNFIKNQVFFKVCVGRFSTKSEAEDYMAGFIKKTSETFSSVISLLDRPGVDKKATAAQVSSAAAEKHKAQARSIASISDKKIDLKEEVSPKKEVKEEVSAPAPEATTITEKPASTAPAVPAEQATETPAAPAQTPATAAEPTGKKTYSVQIAAYPYEEMARVASGKVDAKGKDVFYKPADVNGKTWYRLYVGKFEKYNDAAAFKKEIEHTYDSPIVRKLYE